jgi:heavy metal efflux system protein
MRATVSSPGFLRITLSTSAGAEVQRPLATTVIGGLVSGTLRTPLVLPPGYAFLEERVALHSGRMRAAARGRKSPRRSVS